MRRRLPDERIRGYAERDGVDECVRTVSHVQPEVVVTMPRFLTVSDDASTADLREAVANLRSRQVLCTDPHVRADLGESIDEVVAMIVRRERLAGL